jgi:hypothetical protein
VNRLYRHAASVFLLGLTLANAGTAKAQIDTPMIAPESDFGDIYKRAAASQFVVAGTVTRRDGVGKRWTKDLEAKIRAEGDLSLRLGGTLYTVEVENTVCRQGDFRVRSSVSSEVPQTVYVFLPRDDPAWVDGHMREEFMPGQRYLLFLVAPDQKILDRWTTTYDLDTHRSYFRGEQRARGVVPLRPGELGVLEKTTHLCEAMRPAEVAQKLAALKKLEDSRDPVLEKEAREAEENLRRAKPN